MKKIYALVILIAISLSACGSPAPAPTATAEPTLAPTNTPAPTDTPAPTELPTIAPTVTATPNPYPQEWTGTTTGDGNSQKMIVYIDEGNGTSFTGRTSYPDYGDMNAMQGQYINPFDDTTQQAKWSQFADFNNGSQGGIWLKFNETKILINKSGGANTAGVYYAVIQKDGTMTGFFFNSDDPATKTPAYVIELTLVQAAAPSSAAQGGIPVIKSVTLENDTTSGQLVILQKITFEDSLGDVNSVDYKIVSATTTGLSIQGGTIDIPADQQKSGTAVITGTWTCGGASYSVTLQAVLKDAKGNQSNPYEYTIVCQ